MKRAVTFVLLGIILCSCVNNSPKPPEFSVTVEKMTGAIVAFRKSKNNILFLFMVDPDGKIVRSKLIESKFPNMKDQTVKRIEYDIRNSLRYRPIKNGKHRTVFHATKYKETLYGY